MKRELTGYYQRHQRFRDIHHGHGQSELLTVRVTLRREAVRCTLYCIHQHLMTGGVLIAIALTQHVLRWIATLIYQITDSEHYDIPRFRTLRSAVLCWLHERNELLQLNVVVDQLLLRFF